MLKAVARKERQPLHKSAAQWRREHAFGQDKRRSGERRTLIVIGITAATMIVEIAAGLAFNSMALLADGLNMASHTVAFGITLTAYVYARRHAGDPAYSFGTGKFDALAGFTSALLLAVFAVIMAGESLTRLAEPVTIAFAPALVVAVIGLAVNGLCAVILGGHHPKARHSLEDRDHNLRGAYLHVLADALTSIFAVVALLGGKYLGLVWLDPVIGVVGAVVVGLWSWGLARDTSQVLLDRQGPAALERRVINAVESSDPGNCRVIDLHIWSIGPGIYSVAMALEAARPRSPELYRSLIPEDTGIVHATIEVHGTAGIDQPFT